MKDRLIEIVSLFEQTHLCIYAGNGVANSVSLLLLKQFREMTSSASVMSMFPTGRRVHIDGCLADGLRRRVENNQEQRLRRGFTLGRLDWYQSTMSTELFAGQERGSRL